MYLEIDEKVGLLRSILLSESLIFFSLLKRHKEIPLRHSEDNEVLIESKPNDCSAETFQFANADEVTNSQTKINNWRSNQNRTFDIFRAFACTAWGGRKIAARYLANISFTGVLKLPVRYSRRDAKSEHFYNRSIRNHQGLVAPSIERLITREIIENKSTKIFDCSDPFSLDTKHQFEALIEFGSEFSETHFWD